jgi:hypothetical protein
METKTWTGLFGIPAILSESLIDIMTTTQDYIIEMGNNSNDYWFKVSGLPDSLFTEIKNKYKVESFMKQNEDDKDV